MKTWTSKQTKEHETAAHRLGLIKNEVAEFIAKNSTDIYEKDVVLYVKKAYKRHRLVNDHKKEFAIAAFGVNTREVHHFPTKDYKLQTNDLILLDIWARLDIKGAPYADTTFMLYFGKKIPKPTQKIWDVLVKSRNNAIEYIKKEIKKGKLPRGLDIDRVAHDHIGGNGYPHAIKHTIGHSLGYDSPHGKHPGINWREYSPLLINMGYTIEPGMYLHNLGMRTELDFYINSNYEMIITTPIQKEIEILKSKSKS